MNAASDVAARRLLMLVSGFPPARQFILRSLKFAEHLPQFGWTSTIVTPRAAAAPGLAEVPGGVAVERTLRLPSPAVVARRMRRVRTAPEEDEFDAGSSSAEGGSGRLRRFVLSALLWMDTPDSFVGWIPFAVARGARVARAWGARAIHASGPPFSVVLAGAWLSRLTGLPLVSDFRDAWTLDTDDPIGTVGGTFRAPPSRQRTRVLERMEQWCLARSSAVLFTSQATRSLYVRRYPEIASRAHVIYNGSDPAEFTGSIPPLAAPTIAHVGTLHEFQWRQARAFLVGFTRLLMDGRLPRGTEVSFAGAMSPLLRARLEATAVSLGVGARVRVPGFLPRAQAIALMQGSRVLLLFAGQNPFLRLSKISEYVAAGVPMVAFAAPGSETAEEVRRYGGRIVDDASEKTVADALGQAFTCGGPPLRPFPLPHPHPLNRVSEAQLLARLLDDLARFGTV